MYEEEKLVRYKKNTGIKKKKEFSALSGIALTSRPYAYMQDVMTT